MLPSCFAISRSQGPRPFNFSKPQAFWWRAGFHACALMGVVSGLSMVCEPPAFGFTGTHTKCTHFQFRLWKRAFECSGSLFHLALYFLDAWFTGDAQFGLVLCMCVCVCVSPLVLFCPHKEMTQAEDCSMQKGLGFCLRAGLSLLLFGSLPSKLCALQKNRDFACFVFCCIPSALNCPRHIVGAQ